MMMMMMMMMMTLTIKDNICCTLIGWQALGMALALIVERNCPKDIQNNTSRLFFYVGGIAALTLVSTKIIMLEIVVRTDAATAHDT